MAVLNIKAKANTYTGTRPVSRTVRALFLKFRLRSCLKYRQNLSELNVSLFAISRYFLKIPLMRSLWRCTVLNRASIFTLLSSPVELR